MLLGGSHKNGQSRILVTPRITVDQTGSLAGVKRHDYLPFGEELFAGTGGRTVALGYAGDGVRQQFTQKERDIETGLDYFLARYYSSTQGRFMSPDKPFADQFQANPQSWNTYSYVRNSPCNNVDVKGRCSAPAGLKPCQVGICIESFIAAKSFKTVGLGDNRTFSGDDAKLSAKFKTHIVITPSADKREAYAYQKTEAGVSGIRIPGPIPFVFLQGTANTSLNGANSGSDGSSQTTAPVDTDGITRINATTTAENGFSEATGVDFGTIRTSINLEANVNNGKVQVDAGSQATTYPSMAIYSYSYVDGKLVTSVVWRQSEGSPDDIKKPMQPIPDQTQPKP